jgi:hypothetical protein
MTLRNQYSEENALNAYQNSGKRRDLSHHRHIASTPEGCRISRNDGIGFVVVRGRWQGPGTCTHPAGRLCHLSAIHAQAM